MDTGNQKVKSGKGWLWALLGCLGGMVVVGIIVVIIAMLFFKGVDESINGTNEEQKERKQTANKTFKLGDTVKADGVDITLVKAEFVTPSGEMDTPPNKGKALKVYLKFKNNNEEQVLVQDADFSMKSNGENYQEWFGNGDTEVGFSHQLNNGNTGSGYIVYDVPDNDKYTLEMNFTPNFDTVKAKWEINKSSISEVNNTTDQHSEESYDDSIEDSNEDSMNDSSDGSEDSDSEIVTRSNVMDIVEDYEGSTLDTDTYTYKEPEKRDDGSWGFAFYTKDGELAGSYIVDEDGIVTKYDEDGVEE